MPARHDTTRLRVAITAFFVLSGFTFATWAVRIPAVKSDVGASPAALGIALLGAAAGAITTMSLTGALCRRLGSARVVVVAGAWLSAALVLPALAGSALTLGLLLFVFGIGYGGLNVAMNSLAVDLLATMRRPLMPSFHAAWSLGGLAGSALGGLAAPALSPLADFALVAAGGLVVTAAFGRVVLTTPVPPPPTLGSEPAAPDSTVTDSTAPRNTPADQPNGRGVTAVPPPSRPAVWRTVILLGLIALCASYGEGAISDWGALHLREDLGVAAGLAAAGYAAFALAEAGGRLAGSWLLARRGQTWVLVAGGVVTCAGMLTAALSPWLPLALAGFALTGLGVANAFPAAMSRVGQLAGPHGVGAASTFGYTGFLLGPPVIGFLATVTSLRLALTTVSLLAVVAIVLARLAGREPREGSPGADRT